MVRHFHIKKIKYITIYLMKEYNNIRLWISWDINKFYNIKYNDRNLNILKCIILEKYKIIYDIELDTYLINFNILFRTFNPSNIHVYKKKENDPDVKFFIEELGNDFDIVLNIEKEYELNSNVKFYNMNCNLDYCIIDKAGIKYKWYIQDNYKYAIICNEVKIIKYKIIDDENEYIYDEMNNNIFINIGSFLYPKYPIKVLHIEL